MEADEDYGTYEGLLLKLGGGVIKRHQERWFELRNGCLHYYGARPLGKVDLAAAAIENSGPNSWTISGPGMRHSYTLKAQNEGEKAIWLARLHQSISARNRRRLSSDRIMPSGFSAGSESCSTSLDLTGTTFNNHNTVTETPPLRPAADKKASPTAASAAAAAAAPTAADVTALKAKIDELLDERGEMHAKLAAATAAAAAAPPQPTVAGGNGGGGGGGGLCPQCSGPRAASSAPRKQSIPNKSLLSSDASGDDTMIMATPTASEGISAEGRGDPDDCAEAAAAAAAAACAAGDGAAVQGAVEQMRRALAAAAERRQELEGQLQFERDEQRTLRDDLYQEIDRLKEELCSTYQRMSAAEDQSEELLARAIHASQITTTLATERAAERAERERAAAVGGGGATPTVGGESHSLSSQEAGSLRAAASGGGRHHRSRSCDILSIDGFQRDTEGVVTHAPEEQLQKKVEQKLVQKYIELKKVLHDLQDVGIEWIEHVVTITKYSEDEKLGLTFKKPTNVIKLVTAKLPAARCGLKPGMKIVSVDGIPTPTHDKALSTLIEHRKSFEIIVSEPLTELTARVEGNTLLAEEREAILVENDRLHERLMAYQ